MNLSELQVTALVDLLDAAASFYAEFADIHGYLGERVSHRDYTKQECAEALTQSCGIRPSSYAGRSAEAARSARTESDMRTARLLLAEAARRYEPINERTEAIRACRAAERRLNDGCCPHLEAEVDEHAGRAATRHESSRRF